MDSRTRKGKCREGGKCKRKRVGGRGVNQDRKRRKGQGLQHYAFPCREKAVHLSTLEMSLPSPKSFKREQEEEGRPFTLLLSTLYVSRPRIAASVPPSSLLRNTSYSISPRRPLSLSPTSSLYPPLLPLYLRQKAPLNAICVRGKLFTPECDAF